MLRYHEELRLRRQPAGPVSYTHLDVYKRQDVTSDFALMVEAALGISAELLVNRQARYNIAVSLKEKSLTDKLHEIHKMCALLL